MPRKREKFEFVLRDVQTSPIPQHFVVDAINRGFKEKIGLNLRFGFVDKRKMIEYYARPEQYKIFLEKCGKLVEKDNLLEKAAREATKLADQLNKFTRNKIYRKNLSKLTNRQLWSLYSKFYEIDYKLYIYGPYIFFLGAGDESYAVSALSNVLNNKVKSDTKKKKYMGVLSSPVRMTFNRQEAIAFLKIACDVWRNKKKRELILNSNPDRVQEQDMDLYNLLKKHAEKYAFVFYSWEGPVFEVDYYLMVLKDILKKGNPNKLFTAKKNELGVLKKEISKIYKNLRFTQKEIEIAKRAQFVAYFQPYRKMRQFKSMYEIEGLLKEIAKRLHISLTQVRYFLPDEMKNALLHGKYDSDELNSRYELCVYAWERGRHKLLSGKKARDYIKKNIRIKKKVVKAKFLSGTPACVGKTRGKVRIVNTLEQGEQLRFGEILVSYATNPTLVPAMKKASAIVTEEGGLTCHAAIIAREIGKPCIVGVSDLMDFVKDEDRVEVDANKGIIRKLA